MREDTPATGLWWRQGKGAGFLARRDGPFPIMVGAGGRVKGREDERLAVRGEATDAGLALVGVRRPFAHALAERPIPDLHLAGGGHQREARASAIEYLINNARKPYELEVIAPFVANVEGEQWGWLVEVSTFPASETTIVREGDQGAAVRRKSPCTILILRTWPRGDLSLGGGGAVFVEVPEVSRAIFAAAHETLLVGGKREGAHL